MMRLRLMLLTLGVSLWALLIVGRLLHLQLFGQKDFQRQAAVQSQQTMTLHPRRGPILDRHRQPLALSVQHESIYAVPQDVVDPRRTTAELARTLGLGEAARKDLLASLQSRKAFVWVKRKADLAASRAVRDLQLDGIGFQPESRRYYPNRELASQVLGFVNVDNVGGSGIEYAFDEVIRGREAKVIVRRDAKRRPVGQVDPLGHADKPSTEGHTVVLTLDETIQHATETELERAVASTSATAGIAVVLDPQTGEILALANWPTFNPNMPITCGECWTNRAVSFAYEPGSMFKVITAAAALEQKVVTSDDVIDCGGGFIEIAGQRINDHGVYWNLPFREVMAKSSNVGIIRVARQLGPQLFERYVRDFGFGALTGVALPGEHKGIFRGSERRSAYSLASMSFGQEISVTALQMAAAMGVVASGGYLMKPLIIRQIEDPSGRIVREEKPVAVRRVLQPSTVDVLTDILKGVVREGTGKRAAVPGYTVAGKTGTAQMIDATGAYSMVDHVASFVGFVPASHPALVILVSLERPRGVANQGGDVAAPVFSRIAVEALRRLAVPPDDPGHVLRPTADPAPLLTASASSSATPAAAVATSPGSGMPSLLGLSAREAASVAVRHGLMVQLQGSGRVLDQTPAAGQPIEPGTTCRLVLDRHGWVALAPTPVPARSHPTHIAELRR
jgi:cell division protein FtsI (penicillin-binding protein 3)